MIRSSASLLRASLCGLLLASVSAPALASAATDEQPADAAVDDSGLGMIVVTATKRETNLQETPISMAVMSTEALKDRHVASLYDLADGAVPSLRVATFEARQSALTIGIRGIVPLDANQPAREQGVGIYVDGVYMGRQHGLNAALFDIERVEVLKGPQGTLFGRNTEGGALSIVSKAPTGEWGGRIEAGAGNYGGRTADAHIDLPKIAGFSIKLDGVIQHQDATTENPLAGQAGWNYYNRKGMRAAVRWQPTSTITNDFSYDVAKDENTPFYSQLLNYDPNGCANGTQASQPNCKLPGTNYTNLTGGPVKALLPGVVVNGDSRMSEADIGVPQQVSVDKTHGFTNNLKWHLSDAFELRSITAWRGVDATQWDNSGGAHRPPLVNLGLGTTTSACTAASPCAFSRYSLADLRQRQFSQELQAVGTVGSIDYVAGGFYFNEHVSDDAATPSSMGAVAVKNAAGVVTGANYVTIPFCTASTPAFVGKAVNGCSIDRASEVWSKSYAAYGQLTWNATDALHITVGGRYTHDEKKGVLHYSRNVNYDTATAAFLTGVGYKPLDATWNRFNPMATIAYDVSNGLHVYAKYATGYRAGGASSRTSNYQTFNPEDVKSYEVGLKSDFWNNRARFNLAGYIMDRKNSQVDISSIQFVGTSSFNNLVTINAPGITKIRGIEADLTVEPLDGLTLNASYAYTYTKIPPVLITATNVYQDFYIVFTPRNAASGSIDYALPIGGGDTKLKFHFDGNYSQATQAFDQFATKNDSSLIFNGRISLADIGTGNGRSLTLSLWGRNLFNEQYVFRRDPSNSLPAAPTTSTTTGSIANVLGDYGNFNAPRTYGVEASIKF
ncbi:TonB-dependent receptor [Sphingobium sp.]|uniref:TonB-dependent receptor n=1 Tax=Sphingobium sp. TaxID=1912891 RepID=UPI0028BED465|nr:TonB-dependent receptor [Sphingobium sp.]